MTAMETVVLMWEARAAAGRGPNLLAWTRTRVLTPAPLRRETFTAPGDRVLVMTWWRATSLDADLPDLPDPPPGLLERPVNRWRFLRTQ